MVKCLPSKLSIWKPARQSTTYGVRSQDIPPSTLFTPTPHAEEDIDGTAAPPAPPPSPRPHPGNLGTNRVRDQRRIRYVLRQKQAEVHTQK